jgi:hypothetical protein
MFSAWVHITLLQQWIIDAHQLESEIKLIDLMQKHKRDWVAENAILLGEEICNLTTLGCVFGIAMERQALVVDVKL